MTPNARPRETADPVTRAPAPGCSQTRTAACAAPTTALPARPLTPGGAGPLSGRAGPLPENAFADRRPALRRAAHCYRHRYVNIQRLNHLCTIRHSSARIAGNLIT